jgi:hypothetical protein
MKEEREKEKLKEKKRALLIRNIIITTNEITIVVSEKGDKNNIYTNPQRSRGKIILIR